MGKTNRHQNVSVGQCKFGKGVFANDDITIGTVILKIEGDSISFKEAVNLGDLECYPFQVAIDKYVAPTAETIWQFINHSCDPNCGINGQLEIISLKDIKTNEELFYDYSTTMLERCWTMHCDCGSPYCRQVIADFDTLPNEIQKIYKSLEIVQPYILKVI